ncbi:putative membrane protein yuiD [Senna tora]|uniref:Putative membrane protein yuiD n=1 Tax=Senna tora TaxID=362788 RepID=A0A834TN59_9FABA|nr:putative membrane protein yuiD [Senna tora]
MILQHHHRGFCRVPTPPSQIFSPFSQSRKQRNLILHRELHLLPLRKTTASTFQITCLGPGLFDGVAQLASNKVLVAAFASGIIGQLIKPFASVILYGKKFDIKSVTETGGFPSSHSSATVASATLLGLLRGFSDPIFGLTVVYAGLIMYDAQGVRREVGIHAKRLNKLLHQMQLNSVVRPNDRDCGLVNSQPAGASSTPLIEKSTLSQDQEATFLEPKLNAHLIVKSNKRTRQIINGKLSSSSSSDLSAEDARKLSRLVADHDGLVPFKESVGHTEFEVFGGAVLGFLVGLAVYNFL